MSEIPQDPSAQGDQPPPQPYTTPPPPPPPTSESGPAYGAQAQAPVSPSDARMWAMFAHIGGLLTTFIAPLVIFLIYRDRDPFIRRHAAQALNFQIIIAIGYFLSSMLIFVFIGLLTYPLFFVLSVVFSIIAAIAANKGEKYNYPMIPQMVTEARSPTNTDSATSNTSRRGTTVSASRATAQGQNDPARSLCARPLDRPVRDTVGKPLDRGKR